jgi:hypothetical protein
VLHSSPRDLAGLLPARVLGRSDSDTARAQPQHRYLAALHDSPAGCLREAVETAPRQERDHGIGALKQLVPIALACLAFALG